MARGGTPGGGAGVEAEPRLGEATSTVVPSARVDDLKFFTLKLGRIVAGSDCEERRENPMNMPVTAANVDRFLKPPIPVDRPSDPSPMTDPGFFSTVNLLFFAWRDSSNVVLWPEAWVIL